MSTVFKGNGKAFSNKLQLDKYLNGIDVRGFGASNTLKECIKSLGQTKLIQQIQALQEESNLTNLRFDVDETDHETLQKIALYYLNVYDVTYHDDLFTFIEIKHNMDDGEDGWFKVTRKTKPDDLAADMYGDLKEGNEKYTDSQIIKDITALFTIDDGCMEDLGLTLETIRAVFKKKLFYVIIPVQLEELLKLSAVKKNNGKFSLHKIFQQMKAINMRYSKTNDPHSIGYEVSYDSTDKTTGSAATNVEGKTAHQTTRVDGDDTEEVIDMTKEPHVVPPSPEAKKTKVGTDASAEAGENIAKRSVEEDATDNLPKKQKTVQNPYASTKKGKNNVGEISPKSYGLKAGSFQQLSERKALRAGKTDIQGRQKKFVISFSTPFRVGRSNLKVVMFVEGLDGTSNDNVMFLWKPKAVATAFMIEYYCKDDHYGKGRDHFGTILKGLSEVSLERRSPGSEENERRMVGQDSKYSVPILYGVFDIDDMVDINDEKVLKMKMTELANAVEGVLGHEQFFSSYDIGCHREFSFRLVEDMTEQHFEDNLNSKREGFAAFVVKPGSQKQINGFKKCKFEIKFDVCLDEKMVDEGITNALQLIYGEDYGTDHDIPKSAFPAIFMNPSEKDANALMG
jgi:ribosomal protein L12E/L44/L45/RPP1/RPP2